MRFNDSDGDIKVQYENIIIELNILNIRIRDLEGFKHSITNLKMIEKITRDKHGFENLVWLQPKNNARNNMDENYRIKEKTDLIINIDTAKLDNPILSYYNEQSVPEESMPE